MPSFDIVSEVNQVEVRNAVDQANKEVSTRFDFKGSDARVEVGDKTLTLFADDEFKLKQVTDILLAKLAKRVAPASVRQHLAEQEAERARREQEWRDEQAAKLAEQRAKLAAGEPVRCACCFQPISSPDEAAEKHGSLVHKGDCEQEWGSAYDEPEDPDEEPQP